MRPITVCLLSALAVAAFAAPAFAADMFLTLGPIKGESADRSAAGAPIEIMSWSWGATQMSHAGNGGMGAGKVSMQDMSVMRATPEAAGGGMGAGKVSMQDMSVMRGPRQTTATDGVQVAAGEESTTAGAAGGSGGGGGGGAGKVSMQDMNVTMSVASPRDSASGMPTGKRQHGSLPRPNDRGSVTVAGNLPGCTVGAAYADAVLQTAAMRYELKEVMISSCTVSGSSGGGDAPTESVTLNYASYRESPTRQSQK